jgi:uncharacterized membrane protein YjgN (DUF898 family)
MSTPSDGKPFRFIPKTTIGKGLLALYLVSFVAVALSVAGVVFSEPRMLGPMPEVALWTYFWFGMINVVLLGTYFYLFKPWAETAARYVDGGMMLEEDTSSESASESGSVVEMESDV